MKRKGREGKGRQNKESRVSERKGIERIHKKNKGKGKKTNGRDSRKRFGKWLIKGGWLYEREGLVSLFQVCP